ncbi:glycosyl hydrolase [Demequina aurantiaca]|uniref:glycosyl hydrolase n=1 Tax=Demequina aurantiaca TaxID=676200 RepID=UPI001364AC5A|nr:glycosyl hydrolase [Demequina aurantiaca]
MTPTNIEQLVATVPHESVASPPPMSLADGVIPPTNRWYSALAFNDQANPVFATPLSFSPTGDGFAFGLPRVAVTPDVIAGPANLEFGVGIHGATARPLVSRADPVSVELAYVDQGGKSIARVTLAAGWPVVGVTADAATSLIIPGGFAEQSPAAGGTSVPPEPALITGDINGIEYGALVTGGVFTGGTIDLQPGGTAQFFATPDGSSAQKFAAELGEPVTSVNLEVASNDETATTQLTYNNPGEGTVLAVPASRSEDMECSLGSYATINGVVEVCAGHQSTWEVAAVAPATELDLSDVSEAQREAITTALKEDLAETGTLPADSYFGGKALYRVAMLAMVADALDEPDLRASFLDIVMPALTTWTDPEGCAERDVRCFVYDDAMRGVVGKEASFGADQFNDHHFHYGYFLNAAAVAVGLQPSLEEDIAPVMDLLAADLGSGAGSDSFPELRTFDPFAGHSWASGTSPFADGNNQESSSEAVLAWNGLASWARVRDDDALEATATWMLSAEADAAVRGWVRPDLSDFPEYSHPVVALEWGGKREYSTWFSAEPSAMLGIQLIPMAPMATYLTPPDDKARDIALASLDEAAAGGYSVGFGDYLLMYLALAGPEDAATAWDTAVALDSELIDDGNSRAYMLAWIAST